MFNNMSVNKLSMDCKGIYSSIDGGASWTLSTGASIADTEWHSIASSRSTGQFVVAGNCCNAGNNYAGNNLISFLKLQS